MSNKKTQTTKKLEGREVNSGHGAQHLKGVSPDSKVSLQSSSKKQPTRSKPLVGHLQARRSRMNKKENQEVGTSGIMDLDLGNIVGTLTDVGTTVGGMMAGNPKSFLDIPQTIMKVVNTSSGVVRDLQKSDGTSAPERVMLTKSDVTEKQNANIIESLRKSVPVVNTTNVPTSFAGEFTLPPLSTVEKVHNGAKVLNVVGASVGQPLAFHPTDPTVFYNTFTSRVSPIDFGGAFGTRASNIASNFQKWRLNSLTIQYVPSINTTESGNVVLTCLDGTDIPSSTSLNQASQREMFAMSSVYSGTTLKVRGNTNWYFTSSQFSSDPIKFYTSWTLQFFTIGNDTAFYNGYAGYPIFFFDFDVASGAEAPYSFASKLLNTVRIPWFLSGPSDMTLSQFVKIGALISKSKLEYDQMINLFFASSPLSEKVTLFEGNISCDILSIEKPTWTNGKLKYVQTHMKQPDTYCNFWKHVYDSISCLIGDPTLEKDFDLCCSLDEGSNISKTLSLLSFSSNLWKSHLLDLCPILKKYLSRDFINAFPNYASVYERIEREFVALFKGTAEIFFDTDSEKASLSKLEMDMICLKVYSLLSKNFVKQAKLFDIDLSQEVNSWEGLIKSDLVCTKLYGRKQIVNKVETVILSEKNLDELPENEIVRIVLIFKYLMDKGSTPDSDWFDRNKELLDKYASGRM